jgi:hypothetical protein
MRKFIVERDMPRVGTMARKQLQVAVLKSHEVLRVLGSDIQWLESSVAANKLFCVYLAANEAIIYRHAGLSGFPATKVTEIHQVIDLAFAEYA